MEGEEETFEEVSGEGGTDMEGAAMEISIHTLKGSPSLQMMRVLGLDRGKKLQIRTYSV